MPQVQVAILGSRVQQNLLRPLAEVRGLKMKILKARVEWGQRLIKGKHFGVHPRLHVLVDAMPEGEWRFSAFGPECHRVFFAELGGGVRIVGSRPHSENSPYGRMMLTLTDGSEVEFDPRAVDEATVNYLAFIGTSGFQHVVKVVLYTPMEGVPVCQGAHFVSLDFAKAAAEKCAPPVFLAQERFGWDGSSWYWVPSVKPDTPALPNEEEE